MLGHYTTYAQVDAEEDDQNARKWAYFSDEIVREAEEREVLSCEAYLLFYQRSPKYQEQSNS